jgi:hypothetical protein
MGNNDMHIETSPDPAILADRVAQWMTTVAQAGKLVTLADVEDTMLDGFAKLGFD